MRIISGKYKRRSLVSPKDMSIRPTSDRQRESLFNILNHMNSIVNANVLDLYAGTGALGIECLSRGAQSVVFIDNSFQSIGLIKKNIQHLQIEHFSTVIQSNILNDLACLNGQVFDLILMDPPYQKSYIDKTLSNIVRQHCFDMHTMIVAEHASNEVIHVPKSIKQVESRQYGKTKFSFFQEIYKS